MVKKAKKRSLAQSIREQLGCPVCYKLMSPPIFQCNEGHTICSKCEPRVQLCPLCRGKMPKEARIRNLALEQAASDVKVECSFDQCDVKMKFCDMKAHQQQCGWRPIRCLKCRVMECPGDIFTGSKEEIIKHLEEQHSEQSVEAETVGNVRFTFTCRGGNGKTGWWAKLLHWKSHFIYYLATPFSPKAMQFQLFLIHQGDQEDFRKPLFNLSIAARGKKLQSSGRVMDFRDFFNVRDANEALIVHIDWLYWLFGEENEDNFSISVEFYSDQDAKQITGNT